jgi:hypothetical protein
MSDKSQISEVNARLVSPLPFDRPPGLIDPSNDRYSFTATLVDGKEIPISRDEYIEIAVEHYSRDLNAPSPYYMRAILESQYLPQQP